jgi:hypothetical protein
VSLRRQGAALARSVSSAAVSRTRDEATAAWVTTNRDALLVGGVLAGLLLVWLAGLSWLSLVLVLGLVAAYEAVVHWVGTPAQPSEPSL